MKLIFNYFIVISCHFVLEIMMHLFLIFVNDLVVLYSIVWKSL